MKKRVLIVIVVCALILSVILVAGYGVNSEDPYFLAGLFFRDQEKNNTRDDGVLASYHGTNITRNMVDYQRNMNILRDEETAQEYTTDRQIVDNLIKEKILLEEAQRLGLTATQEQIDKMVDDVWLSYSIPEGKEMIDAYLEGAGMAFEEYVQLIEQLAPAIIAKQNVRAWVAKQYCDENGLEYPMVNPPREMLQAQDDYVENLLREKKSEVVYYIDD